MLYVINSPKIDFGRPYRWHIINYFTIMSICHHKLSMFPWYWVINEAILSIIIAKIHQQFILSWPGKVFTNAFFSLEVIAWCALKTICPTFSLLQLRMLDLTSTTHHLSCTHLTRSYTIYTLLQLNCTFPNYHWQYSPDSDVLLLGGGGSVLSQLNQMEICCPS